MPTTYDTVYNIGATASTSCNGSYTTTTTTAADSAVYTITAADTLTSFPTTITWPTITVTTDEKIKEYTDKTDKHIDELEQDIEFLNTEREKTNVLLKDYEDKINCFKICIDYMQTKIAELEDKLNEMDKG